MGIIASVSEIRLGWTKQYDSVVGSLQYIILWINPAQYMLGSVLGTILSIANAFFWNDRFVFNGNKNDFRSKMIRLGKTYVSYGGTSLLSIGLLWIEVSLFGVNKAIAPIVNLVITILLNFVIKKLWGCLDEKNKLIRLYPARWRIYKRLAF